MGRQEGVSGPSTDMRTEERTGSWNMLEQRTGHGRQGPGASVLRQVTEKGPSRNVRTGDRAGSGVRTTESMGN